MDIKNLLLESKVFPNLKGFDYIIKAVDYARDYYKLYGRMPQLLKETFHAVALMKNVSISSVERNVKTCVDIIRKSNKEHKVLKNLRTCGDLIGYLTFETKNKN